MKQKFNELEGAGNLKGTSTNYVGYWERVVDSGTDKISCTSVIQYDTIMFDIYNASSTRVKHQNPHPSYFITFEETK